MMRLVCGAVIVLAAMIAPAAAEGLPTVYVPQPAVEGTLDAAEEGVLAMESQMAEARGCAPHQPCEPVEVAADTGNTPAQYSRLGGAVLDLLRQGSIFVLH